MNFEEIKENIRHWNEIRTNSELLKSYFSNAVSFEIKFSIQSMPNVGEYIHFYPAISNGNLVFYVIKSIDDKSAVHEENPTSFTSYIETSEIARESPNEARQADIQSIPVEAALERVLDWNKYGEDWIDAKAENGGIYQALSVPVEEGFPEGDITVFFALKSVDDPQSINFRADLILFSGGAVFYDTVRPVPPFGQGEEAAFYLLEAAVGVPQ